MSGQSEGDPKEGQASCAHPQAPHKVTNTSTYITSLKEHTHNTHTHSHADTHIHTLMHIHVHVHAHECVCRHVTVPCAWPSCACTLVYTTLRHSLFYQSPIPMPALPSNAPHCPALAPIIPHPHTMVRYIYIYISGERERESETETETEREREASKSPTYA